MALWFSVPLCVPLLSQRILSLVAAEGCLRITTEDRIRSPSPLVSLNPFDSLMAGRDLQSIFPHSILDYDYEYDIDCDILFDSPVVNLIVNFIEKSTECPSQNFVDR